MSEEQKKHPLEEYPENEQIAYLSILSAVCYVDKEFTDKEKRQLEILLKQLKISDAGKSKIYSQYLAFNRKINIATSKQLMTLAIRN